MHPIRKGFKEANVSSYNSVSQGFVSFLKNLNFEMVKKRIKQKTSVLVLIIS